VQRVVREQGPALLFSNPTRGQMPLLMNLFGTEARMCKALAFELEIDGVTHMASSSIGIACYPDDGLSIDQLLARSDHALYAAKAAGRGTFCFYRQPNPTLN